MYTQAYKVFSKLLLLLIAIQCEGKSLRGLKTAVVRRSRRANSNCSSILMTFSRGKHSKASITQDVSIMSKSLLFLAINKNRVHFTSDTTNQNIQLQMESIKACGYVRIYGKKSKRYLAMNSRGVLYTTMKANKDTVFLQEMAPNSFSTFKSEHRHKKKDMYIGVRKDGKPKKGHKTSRTNISAFFLVINQHLN
ncbi:fibroblast growth factor 1-like [Exaiptasia diaphana]|uniref:FGF n=1 Tax=Exaiptasia diaphana TaxID=2652724 RepID=A0A913WR76_EXADI|nr:fibroblast growth factor 1-like [Exaiptasia diaphana]